MRLLSAKGWTVYSCGHVSAGPGVDDSAGFFLVDILDVDAVASLVEELGVDMLYSVGSDIAMPTVAAVSERLGLPLFHSSELIEVLHRKVNLRGFFAEHHISEVPYAVLRSAADVAGFDAYPAIVKPSDSQGQRGITVVADAEEAIAALDDAIAASHTASAVIEKFLDGPEVSVHVFVVDGIVKFFLPSDRIVWDGPAVGVPAAHALPAEFLQPGDAEEIRRLVVATVDALGVTTGPLYFQLKMTAEGPRVIEIAPRLDGCHLWRLVEFATGFNILERCFDLLAGASWVEASDDVAHAVRLDFLLGSPDQAFDPDQWPAPEARVLFEEHQVEPGALPRSINPVVTRLGYRIVATN